MRTITPKGIHDLAAAARRGARTEAELDRWLSERAVRDPETRMAIKVSLMAQGELATDQGLQIGELATDVSRHTPAILPLSREMATLYRKAKLTSTRSYAPAEIDQALADAELDVTSKIALRTELSMRRQVRAAGSVQAARSRTMRAAADTPRPRGKILMDQTTGQPLVLRGTSW